MLRVVSHTPIECEKLVGVQKAGDWVDSMRQFTPEPAKLYTWWSYRSPDWATADKGRRLDHIWTSPMLADRVAGIAVAKHYRGAARPSDHVPVTAALEVVAAIESATAVRYRAPEWRDTFSKSRAN